jgi:heme exporter protein A
MSASLVSMQASRERTSEPSRTLVSVDRLTKLYDQRPILRNVSFTLPAGQALVLFGPNGAGKTTLLRMLATLTRPSSGTATIAGLDLATEPAAVRFRIGYVGHRPHLYDELTARENLLFFARMYGLRDGSERAERLLARVGLAAKARDRVANFSRGQVQRLALARGILHEPSLLLLDEPDTGLDAGALALLNGIVSEQVTRGGSVLLTTHAIERGLSIAGGALILARGRVVHAAPAGELTPERVIKFYNERGRMSA